jgi:HemY protein
MKWLITSLVTLLVAVIVALLAMEDPGYVLVSVGPWTLETSLVVASVIVFLSFSVLYYGIRTTINILAIPSGMQHWQLQRKEKKSQQQLNDGLLYLAEGQWQAAEKQVLKSLKFSQQRQKNIKSSEKNTLLSYLAIARAAQAQGAGERRDYYLKLAIEKYPTADIAVGLTQAELQLQQQQLEQALATLAHLQTLAPKNVAVLHAVADIYVRLQDWEHLLELMPTLRKLKVVKDEMIEGWYEIAYLGLLKAAKSAADVRDVWSRVPKQRQENHALLMLYVQRLLETQQSELAEPLLRHALERQPNDILVAIYGKIESADSARQLKVVETLLAGQPQNAVLLLTAGRLSLCNKLWGKARAYFEASVSSSASAEAYNELGYLLERMGETSAAAECFRQGLGLIVGCGQTIPIVMEVTANPQVSLGRE